MTHLLETNGRTPSPCRESTVRSFSTPSLARMPGGAFFLRADSPVIGGHGSEGRVSRDVAGNGRARLRVAVLTPLTTLGCNSLGTL